MCSHVNTLICEFQLYRSLVGADGWCINYNKSSRTCSIYAGEHLLCCHIELWSASPMKSDSSWADCVLDRPYFCRVEPEIFETLYGINKKRFDKEACRYQTRTLGSCLQSLYKFQFWALFIVFIFLAVAVEIQLETYMVPNQKSSITLIMRRGARLLVNYFG